MQDLRYALRSYRRTPGFTAVAVVTLALGIGGATAIFSVVDGILLRPLPYDDAATLVRASRITTNGEDGAFSAGDFLDLQRDASTLTAFSGYREDIADVTGSGDPVRVPGVQTTASFFEAFGVQAVVGRVYGNQDRPGTAVGVIGAGFWRRHYGERPDIVGTTIRVNGRPIEIVGVVPDWFRHPLAADLWTLSPNEVPESPIASDSELANREVQYFGVVGRLAPGATMASANAQLADIAERLGREFPDTNSGESFRVERLDRFMVQDVRASLLVLLGAVGCVLLIACANVAGLMLARGLARRRELAVRASLGASGSRLARQLLTESIILAAAGGAAGLLVAAWGVDLLMALAPESLSRLAVVELDWRVAGISLALTTGVGVLAGLAPALQSSRPHVNEDLKDGGRTGTSSRTRLRSALVVAEVAAALVLLIGAGLMVSSLSKLQAVDPGFRTSSLVAIELPLPQARYNEAGQRRFYGDLLARMQGLPGLSESAVVFPFPLRGSSAAATYEVEGQEAQTRSVQPRADLNAVSPEYFQTAGIRLMTGRTFTALDGPDSLPVAIVNERLARDASLEDPVGRRINIGDWFTVVGVVSDARRASLAEPAQPAIYLPYTQFVVPFMGLVVRTDLAPGVVASAVRGTVQGLDADLPLGEVLTIEQILEEATGQPRFRTAILLTFAGLALVLAAVGIYGLMSFAVSQRTAEMGVRLALGARPWQVCTLVMRQGVWLAGMGTVLGIGLALAAGRGLAGLLFDTSLTDPLVYASLTTVLLTIAALACYVPARRAMRVDPVRALRSE